MRFPAQLVPIAKIERIDNPNGRWYVCNDKVAYPSVTTILGQTKHYANKKKSLEAWQARVGDAEASGILHQAGNRGTILHNQVEAYIKGENSDSTRIMPVNLNLIKQIQHALSENVNMIYGIELPLYSDRLKAAGTSDLIAKWKDKISIIDYKTSRSQKRREWIESYFVQKEAYAEMFETMYGIEIEQLVTIVVGNYSPIPQIFINESGKFANIVEEIFVSERTYN